MKIPSFLLLPPTDIDECAKDWDDCNDTITTCFNLPGSYNCTCPEKNFAWNGQICVGNEYLFQAFDHNDIKKEVGEYERNNHCS